MQETCTCSFFISCWRVPEFASAIARLLSDYSGDLPNGKGLTLCEKRWVENHKNEYENRA